MSGGGVIGLQILDDANRRPDLFLWVGRPEADAVTLWLGEHGIDVPPDLVSFWQATGGGLAFESEELLAPLGSSHADDGLWPTNRRHRSQGMPEGFVVFHEGAWVSAFRGTAPRYVTLTLPSYQVDGEYASLEEWYLRTLRAEYAERYGLDMARGSRTRG
jgi:hypothetical protein